MMIKLKARAKINLTLDVLKKRCDGYHELETVMQALTLSDIIKLELLPAGKLELKCSDSRLQDENNLAYRAAKLLQNFYPGRGVRITLEKRIPLAAGLAGGSSDAAAVLKRFELPLAAAVTTSSIIPIGRVSGR